MNITVIGAAGFIGTNLAMQLVENPNCKIKLVDKKREYFVDFMREHYTNVEIIESSLDNEKEFNKILKKQDIVYHLVSSTIPATSNQHIAQELATNVIFSANMLDACVKNDVKKVVFISSGGTVYGKENNCPLNEMTKTYPISSYGIQKITIEKLLYLYNYMYGLDYRVVRLANPYGPYQRPNGVLGAVTTFTYRALKDEKIIVYGDGSVIRDYIYIDDAIKAIINITFGECEYRTFNVGCGYGTSINEVIDKIQNVLQKKLLVSYQKGRQVDVPINYLDISRYEKRYGVLSTIDLNLGIERTAEFLKKKYLI